MLNTLPQATKKHFASALIAMFALFSASSFAAYDKAESDEWHIRDVTWRVDFGASILKLKVIDDFSAPPPEYGNTQLSPLVASH